MTPYHKHLLGSKPLLGQPYPISSLIAGTFSGYAMQPSGPLPVERRDTEIIGWRAWGLGQDEHGPTLVGCYKVTPWEGPGLVADVVPDPQHNHGIYAYKAQEPAARYIHDGGVIGSVALSGRVIECEKGYRAERAVIRSLYLRYPRPGTTNEKGLYNDLRYLADRLSARYGVEVEVEPWPEKEKAKYQIFLETQRRKQEVADRLWSSLQEYATLNGMSDLCVGTLGGDRPTYFIGKATSKIQYNGGGGGYTVEVRLLNSWEV